MKKTQIFIAPVPAVSRDFAKDLNQRFRPITITPETPINEIMFNAGCRKVIEFVLNAASGSEIIGDPEQLREAKTEKVSLLKQLLDRFVRVEKL